MHKCILCPNSSTSNSNVTYHSFPRNLVRRNQWVENLKMDKCFDWQRICSEHFIDDDFKPGEKRLLRPNALPKCPTNEIRTYEKHLIPNDVNVKNNTTNEFNSPRRSSRKIKKPKQLLDNEVVTKLPACNVASADSGTQVPLSIPNTNKKMTVQKKGNPSAYYLRCSVVNCNNSYSNSNVSFFGYPVNSLRRLWIANCGTQGLVTVENGKKKHLKVCGKHFENSMFINPKKRNRLKPNAIPSLFISKGIRSNTSESTTVENHNVESTSVEEESSTAYLIQPSVEFNENISDETNMDTNTNLESLCCIPGCINNSEDEMVPELLFLFSPPIEDIDKWSSILGIQMTESSRVCENHFKPQDFTSIHTTENIGKTLLPGAVPSIIKPYKDEPKNIEYDTSPKDVGYISLQLNEVSTETLSQTMIDSSSDVSQSSLIHNENTSTVNNITEVDNNNILRQSLETITEPIPLITSTDKLKLRIEKIPKVFSSNSIPQSSQSRFINNDRTPAINITEVETNTNLRQLLETNTESIASTDESRSRIEKILPKMFSNSSVSITMESSDNKSKQSSAVNSIEIIKATSILKPTLITESTGILSKTSTNNSTPNNTQSNLIQILPKTFTDGSISITMKSSTQQNKQLSEIDPTKIFNSADILKPTSSADSFMSNSIESTFEDPILKNLVNNNSVSITTRELNYIQNNPITITNSNDISESSSVVDEIKPEPTETPPSTSTDNSILNSTQVNYDQVHSDKLDNRAQHTYSISTINQSRPVPIINSDLVDEHETSPAAKRIKLEPVEIVEFPTTSTNDVIFVPETNTIENINDNSIFFIRDISKTVILPNCYWKCLHHRKLNHTAFIERNEFMEPVKKVLFKTSLVPFIYINNKSYDYNEVIDTKIALENLLVKIDNIQICSGYDGYTHDQCIGYLENNSSESEVCCRCQDLVEKEFFSRFDVLITDKTNIIKRIEKNINEREERILEIKNRLQQKRKDPKNVYKSNNSVVCER